MNSTDPDIQRSKRSLKNAEAYLADLRLDQLSRVERIEQDLLPEQGVVTSDEIRQGLDLC